MSNNKKIVVNRKEERLRRFTNIQIIKLKKVASVGSLILLILNLSLTIYPFIEHRNIHPYIAVPSLFLMITLIVLLLAHIYLKWLDMYRTEAEAEKYYNPYSVYAFGPWEEMMFRNLWIPLLNTMYLLLPEGKEKKDVKKILDDLWKWTDLGYIPKSDFPEHLKKFYITSKEARL